MYWAFKSVLAIRYTKLSGIELELYTYWQNALIKQTFEVDDYFTMLNCKELMMIILFT